MPTANEIYLNVQSTTQPDTDQFGVTLRVGDGLSDRETDVVAAVAAVIESNPDLTVVTARKTLVDSALVDFRPPAPEPEPAPEPTPEPGPDTSGA